MVTSPPECWPCWRSSPQGYVRCFVFRRRLQCRGLTDIIVDYYHAIQSGLPAMAGQLGSTYAIAIIYVPLLMITHVVAFYFLLRPQKENRYA